MQTKFKTCALVGSMLFAPLAYVASERTSQRDDLCMKRKVFSTSVGRPLPQQTSNGFAGYTSATLAHLVFHENKIGNGVGTDIELYMCGGKGREVITCRSLSNQNLI